MQPSAARQQGGNGARGDETRDGNSTRCKLHDSTVRAANEGEENYDYTHRCFSKVVDFSNGVFQIFKIFVEYIQFAMEIYFSIFEDLLV